MPARDLIDRLGREEDAFFRAEFVSPVAGRGSVKVRIAGIVCTLSVRNPRDGWHVLKPVGPREAEIVRPATRTQVRDYLKLFPRARLVACFCYGRTWLGRQATAPGRGARIEGLVPIALSEGLLLFQTAVVRFDGAAFLLESTERHPQAAWLRDQLQRRIEPPDLKRPGLLPAEREAYADMLRLQQDLERAPEERRLAAALEKAGATLDSYAEERGVFRVTFLVGGERKTAVVSKSDLTVVSAGICLDGRDGDFDLTSLVSVFRQAWREGHDGHD